MPSRRTSPTALASASPFADGVSVGVSRFEPVVVALALMLLLEDVGAAVMLGENVRVIVDDCEAVEIRDGRRVVWAYFQWAWGRRMLAREARENADRPTTPSTKSSSSYGNWIQALFTSRFNGLI